MEINSNLIINWLNIIFSDDLLAYLKLESIKEISLISKLVRGKLKPRLFKHLELSANNYDFKFKNNIFIEYIKDYLNCVPNNRAHSSAKLVQKDSLLEAGIGEFTYSLLNIKRFVKNFRLSDTNKAGYYLFHLSCIFINLTNLNITSCIIPYNGFCKLGESLLNLKCIKLIQVKFAKVLVDYLNRDDYKFSPCLDILEVYQCSAINLQTLSDPSELIFIENARLMYTYFDLPMVSVPSLKRLTFFGNGLSDNGYKYFLDANPSLESLKVEFLDLSAVKNLKSLSILEIGTVTKIDTMIHAAALEYVKVLKIGSLCSIYYQNIEKLCLLCCNLEYLHFSIGYEGFQHAINSYLERIVCKLDKLKTLHLSISHIEGENLDVSIFTNVESIIIEAESSILINLIFENCENLKEVKFISINSEINKQQFKDKFSSYNNWNWSFSDNIIKGHKY
ncbi:hypothetical protein CONCODRAFT_11265 [Conidiobolus coronatus NRRL 28638]|uniref:RNI-like protein n=1 Tax=Conidiobolus coronatus (strain ATCC 28846 / CBS 209.66 / NRRL 28638) TaxID=796925 RepID=A0A137NVJ4_CONC2|nr:hypothetical protein CONCODRAFT_11265 [Conidiobolus coronatus NRRL 28638]|eukprot:KXN66823.1 hypothetical protein CONCODRAFT_11265 [Conidiobolus coronatus NRRL 28638]